MPQKRTPTPRVPKTRTPKPRAANARTPKAGTATAPGATARARPARTPQPGTTRLRKPHAGKPQPGKPQPGKPAPRSRNRNAARNPDVVAADGVTLVLGGIRSGKSVHAEDLTLALSGARRPTYVATADSALSKSDPGMTARIERHRGRRGDKWVSVEAVLDVPGAIAAAAKTSPVVLVDSLTVWLSNVMESRRGLAREIDRLVAALQAAAAPVVLVSDEVGLGGISANALARGFADALGTLNETVAAVADRVVLVAAGLPITLKDNSAQRASTQRRGAQSPGAQRASTHAPIHSKPKGRP